jgi:hypothetical protein
MDNYPLIRSIGYSVNSVDLKHIYLYLNAAYAA